MATVIGIEYTFFWEVVRTYVWVKLPKLTVVELELPRRVPLRSNDSVYVPTPRLMLLLVKVPGVFPFRSTQFISSGETHRLLAMLVEKVPTTSTLPEVTVKPPTVPVLLRPVATVLKFSEKIIEAWPTPENADTLKPKNASSVDDFTESSDS